ncbi:nuclear transport factor 2 family protein [Mycoplana dimorpha]|uniref:Ketosteroid isomerase-like protein n=1 Tax=Mycoplana dimorpha TaxID=28320 RepID=A0A2T5B327_MYCDI|nr:nuclear transport factor 2 family protein [Mycoplana dimorpha]PTM93379.1 ketosteroid isomerase-like protein [Mycoplana dimorpha]
MTDRSELERTAQALYQARNDNDVDAMMSFVDPDASFHIAGNYRLGPLTHVVDGAAEIRARFSDLVEAWDLSGMDYDSMYVDGDTVLVHRTGSVRYIADDSRFPTEILDKLTFRDGRIVAFTEFVDTLMAAEAIGFVKPSGVWTGDATVSTEPPEEEDRLDA